VDFLNILLIAFQVKRGHTTVQQNDIMDKSILYSRRVITGTIEVEPDGAKLFLLLPQTGEITILEMIEKYLSFAAIEQVEKYDSELLIRIPQGGTFAFLTKNEISDITMDGVPVTPVIQAGFALKEKDKVYIRVKGMDTICRNAQDFVRTAENKRRCAVIRYSAHGMLIHVVAGDTSASGAVCQNSRIP